MQIRLLASLVLALLSPQALAQLPQIPDPENIWTFPAEDSIVHEATWLQWPHNNGWDKEHEERYQDIWVQMTKALHTGERVRLIVYDSAQQTRVTDLLTQSGVDMSKIDFFIHKTDDVWARDNGPVFVLDQDKKLLIENWDFNGWVSHCPSNALICFLISSQSNKSMFCSRREKDRSLKMII